MWYKKEKYDKYCEYIEEIEVNISPEQKLYKLLLNYAQQNNLKRSNEEEYIYKKQKPGCYLRWITYDKFIATVLTGNTLYNNKHNYTAVLLTYLRTRDDINDIQKDWRYFGFKNGVFNIEVSKFTKYEDIGENEDFVIRQYIDIDFSGKTESPLYDSIFKYQDLNDDVIEFDKLFIGRMLYGIKSLDNWNIMNVLYGLSQTGKSTKLKVLSKFFNNIGSLSNRNNDKHYLDGAEQNDILVCYEIPKRCEQNLLEHTDLQKMISGEIIRIRPLNKRAINVNWNIPLFFVGNYPLDYEDNNNALYERIAYTNFHKQVKLKDCDGDLENKIFEQELDRIFLSSIQTYKKYAEKYGNKQFWSFCPTYFKQQRELIKRNNNYELKWLESGPDDNITKDFVYYPMYEEGCITLLSDAKKSFINYMNFKENVKLSKFSFTREIFNEKEMYFETQHICKSCLKKAQGGKDKCCEDYKKKNRSKREVILNLKLMKMRVQEYYNKINNVEEVENEYDPLDL